MKKLKTSQNLKTDSIIEDGSGVIPSRTIEGDYIRVEFVEATLLSIASKTSYQDRNQELTMQQYGLNHTPPWKCGDFVMKPLNGEGVQPV